MRRVILAGLCALSLAAALSASSALAAAGPGLTPTLPDCIPDGENALVSLAIVPEIGWSSIRVYFRDHEEELWYFLEMRAAGGGRYWAALPQPDLDTSEVDVFFRVRDYQGTVTETEVVVLDVSSSCDAELTDEQKAFARNLVIGETSPDQKDRQVFGFQCDGIISRLEEYTGDLRPDDYCRAVILAAVVPKSRLLLLLPLVFTFDDPGGGGVVPGGDPGEVSASNP